MESIVNTIISKITSTTSKQELAQLILWTLAKETNCTQGAFYIRENQTLKFIEGYAFHLTEENNLDIEVGDGITGQVAKDGNYINISNVPDGYLTVLSGLGQSSPTNLLVYPFKQNNSVKVVIELASFEKISAETIQAIEKISTPLIEKINTL
jgi:putative methionine-R-sulfoxide reductase with GAF domain